jgi:Protein of unknown function (DUF2510)
MAIIYLIIALAIGFVAYRSSEAFRREHNVTPWHLPSLVWGFIGFLSLILCAVLLLIARKTTKTVAASTANQPQIPHSGWYPDPAAEHELRYWDGSQWTSRVEDGGVELAADS